MNTFQIVSWLLIYLFMGWCWADILSHFADPKLNRPRFLLALVFWPLSLILTDAELEDEYEKH